MQGKWRPEKKERANLVRQGVTRVVTKVEIGLKAVKVGRVQYPPFTTSTVIGNSVALCHLTNLTKGMINIKKADKNFVGIVSNNI